MEWSIEKTKLLRGEVMSVSEWASVCMVSDIRAANKERTGGAS